MENNINKVTLLGYYGGDKRHCLSAWQSTTDELGLELPNSLTDRIDYIFAHLAKKKKKSPQELLFFLAEHGHNTPFEKSLLDFQVTADIASHIHCLKHRIGVSINSESARYKELIDKFYTPLDWLKIKVSKEGREELSKNAVLAALGGWCEWEWGKMLEGWNKCSAELYHAAAADLTDKLGRKRAKESSRYFLTYSKQLNFDITFNFRSFMHFLALRNSKHAQVEIRHLAAKMLRLVKTQTNDNFYYSLKAFNL